MKNLTKKLMILLSLSGSISAFAFSEFHGQQGTVILCAQKQSPEFKLKLLLENKIDEKRFSTQTKYEAIFYSFYGPRLSGHKYPVIAEVTLVTTRVHVGHSYDVEVEGLGHLSLLSIIYSAEGSTMLEPGFYGVFTDKEGSETHLTCGYVI